MLRCRQRASHVGSCGYLAVFRSLAIQRDAAVRMEISYCIPWYWGDAATLITQVRSFQQHSICVEVFTDINAIQIASRQSHAVLTRKQAQSSSTIAQAGP